MDILIVENDSIVTKLWSKKLAECYQVRAATSVDTAKAEIMQKIPDLVILDIRLNGPTHSGLNVYEYIRSDLKGQIPIIFVTGLAYNVDLFQKAQAYAHSDALVGVKTSIVEKPVRINDLYGIVNRSIAA